MSTTFPFSDIWNQGISFYIMILQYPSNNTNIEPLTLYIRPGRRVQPSKWRFLKVFNSPTFKLEGFLKDFDPSILHNWRFLKVLTHFTFKNDYFLKVFKRLHNIWMKSTGCFFTGHTLNNLESKFKGGPLKKHPVDGSIINLLLFSCLFWLN